MFLLADPPYLSTIECVISATEFTYSMISSCKTSVVSMKLLKIQNPKIQ